MSDDLTMKRTPELTALGEGGDPSAEVCKLAAPVAAAGWVVTGRGTPSTQVVVACTDGSVRMIDSSTGREERRFEASSKGRGAVTAVAWSSSGEDVATGGEDGSVKLWSRMGMLRSQLEQASGPVRAVRWSADGQRLLWCTGSDVVIRSKGSDRTRTTWKAHAGACLCADWSSVHGMVVTGGEDGKYRVWDDTGRQLFASAALPHAVTAVAWSPSGATFAAASHDSLRFCDRLGWSRSRHVHSAGSLLQLSWSADGTTLAGAGAGGRAVAASVLGLSASDGGSSAELVDRSTLKVFSGEGTAAAGTAAASGMGGGPSSGAGSGAGAGGDLDGDMVEVRGRVTALAMQHGHMVVGTRTHLHVYKLAGADFTTPHTVEVSSPPRLLLLDRAHFCSVDVAGTVAIFSYDGRLLCRPRQSGMRADTLDTSTLSLARDALLMIDGGDPKVVRVFDTRTGRSLASYSHTCSLKQVALSTFSDTLARRRAALLDANGDLWITPLQAPDPQRLQGMCDSCAWADDADALAAAGDGQLAAWLAPSAVFTDRTLCEAAREVRPAAEWGALPRIRSFGGALAVAEKGDGAMVAKSAGRHTAALHRLCQASNWEHAVRLCRFVGEDCLWAALAAMALDAAHLDSAEVSLAALRMTDKLHFVQHVKEVPSREGQAAEMALLRRRPDEAERVLLQASPPLLYRAVKMNVRLFRWARALEIARQFGGPQAGDLEQVVLAYRWRHQADGGVIPQLPPADAEEAAKAGGPGPDAVEATRALQAAETIPEMQAAFSAVAGRGVDWSRVSAIKASAKAEEERRPGAKPVGAGGAQGGPAGM